MSDKPRILGPDGQAVRKDAPKLVDPQGRPLHAKAGIDDEFRPRLRAIDFSAVREGKNEYLVASDPLGICEDAVALRLEVVPLLQLLDGQRTVGEIARHLITETGDPSHGDAIRTLIDDLDRLLLLESPRFDEKKRENAIAYGKETVREAKLAGQSYPIDKDELQKFLAGQYAEARAVLAANGSQDPPANPSALAVPHLDLRRAGWLVALGFESIPVSPPPDLVVIFGTGHSLYEHAVAVTSKSFETPLGSLESDLEAVERLLQSTGEDARAEETAHRHEHSIEFAVLHLAYRFGTNLKILPVLFGGFHRLLLSGQKPTEDTLYQSTIRALRSEVSRARESGARVLLLAAVDLSHVGARFGDVDPLTQEKLEEIRIMDEKALSAAAGGKADDWFNEIASHGDSTRICGYAALHALLDVAQPAPGTLIRYEQSLEQEGSVVSCATLAWPQGKKSGGP